MICCFDIIIFFLKINGMLIVGQLFCQYIAMVFDIVCVVMLYFMLNVLYGQT